jgi:hypothetical protein
MDIFIRMQYAFKKQAQLPSLRILLPSTQKYRLWLTTGVTFYP